MGIVDGLDLDCSFRSLARLYDATTHALAYSTREIVDAMGAEGVAVTEIRVCGGGSKNPLYLQAHADVLGVPVLVGHPDAVGATLATPRQRARTKAGEKVCAHW